MIKKPNELNSHLDFLSQLSDEDKSELLRIGYKKSFLKNDFIFRTGDFDANIWILIQGRIKIFKSSVQGRDLLLWFTTPGDIFGIAECMHERTRMVNARAAESSELICVPHAKFKDWVIARPKIAYMLIQIVSGRLREISNRFLSLANGNIQLEITQLLISLGIRYGTQVGSEIHFGIPFTEQDIADMAGTSRQGVSTLLADLKRQEIIECEHHLIVIKKLDQLEDMANIKNKTASTSKQIHISRKTEVPNKLPI